MASYLYGTNDSAADRQDLAPVVGRYMGFNIADGMGSREAWGALAVAGIVEVPGAGRFTYDAKQFQSQTDATNDKAIRPLNAERPPIAESAKYDTYNILPYERGKAVSFDEADPQVNIRQRQRGTAGVETWQMNRSANICLETLDHMFFGDPSVAGAAMGDTTNAYWAGWDGSTLAAAADVSATSAQWSTTSSDVVLQFMNARINYEAATGRDDLDTAIMSAKSKLYLAQNTGFRLLTGVTSTSGAMSDDMLRGALSALGFRYLIVLPTGKPVTDQVFLTRAGAVAGRDPLTEFTGSLLAWQRMPTYSHDDRGFSYQMWSADAGRVHFAYCSHVSAPAFPYEGGVRITDVY